MLWGPPPNATTRSGSSIRSSQGLTAATETAGVRRLVSATPSSRWVGRSVAASNNTYAALIRGSPRAGLSGATVASLTPTDDALWAGIRSRSPCWTGTCERGTSAAGSTSPRRPASTASTAASGGRQAAMSAAST